jgi:hypothetical protein
MRITRVQSPCQNGLDRIRQKIQHSLRKSWVPGRSGCPQSKRAFSRFAQLVLMGRRARVKAAEVVTNPSVAREKS